jgi:hypothetical protein
MHNIGFRRLTRVAAAVALACGTWVLDARAATINVRAGDNLQAAIDAALPGDTLLLEAGATFAGNFVLPVKSGADFITIRTADLAGALPGSGDRISPADSPRLAKIRSSNTMAALRTAPGAHHWRLLLLEFPANRDGYGEIIQIGDSSAQYLLSQVPYALELDRLLIYGDPLMGQKRGVALNGASVTIRNSHISGIRGVGMDTQAICGWNGPGPYLIENNYLEAAGENLMFGGGDPSIPNLVPSNITIRNNYFSRPMSWRNPVVATPAGLSAQVRTGGTLTGGLHTYWVVARQRVAAGVTARSAASAQTSVQVATGQGVTVSWTPVPGASDYQVYRRSPSGVSEFWTTTGTPFIDSGSSGQAGAAPTSPGHTWVVKNVLELKNARNVVIQQNVFENNWGGAGQSGYSIVFTPRNQDGGCSWCVVEDVTFEQNLLRNVAAGINIMGYDDLRPSQQTRRIRVFNNIARLTQTLVGTGWFMLVGNGPRDVFIDHNTVDSDGTTILYVYGSLSSSGGVLPISGFRFTNNAARHLDYGINGSEAGFGNGIIALYFPDGVVTGNWLQGGSASRYPAGNYVDGTFESAFANSSLGDYTPTSTGPLWGRATDGAHIGALLPTAATLYASVISGQAFARPRPSTNLRIGGD